MKCSKCHSITGILETRLDKENVVRRRHQCINTTCLHRFTTKQITSDRLDELQKAFDWMCNVKEKGYYVTNDGRFTVFARMPAYPPPT